MNKNNVNLYNFHYYFSGGHRVDVNCSLGSLVDPVNTNSNLLELQGKMVIQSSTNKSASNAIDGDMTTCSLTLITSGYSWWQVDLIQYFIIGRIEIAVTLGHGEFIFFVHSTLYTNPLYHYNGSC